MPSRRRVLAAGGFAVAGLSWSAAVGDSRPIPFSRSAVGTGSRSSAFDWPMARYDAAGTGNNPDSSGPTDGATVAWERRFDDARFGVFAPILAGDTLFAVGERSIVAFDRETGRVRFSRTGPYYSSPARAEASAYRTDTLALNGAAGIYGLNAGGGYEFLGIEFGTERWHGPGQAPARATARTASHRSPVAADDAVYAIVPETERVAAFDASSGRLRWERTLGDPRSVGAHRPAVRDGTVYVSSSAGDVVALDAETGDDYWSVKLEYGEDDIIRNLLAPTATERGVLVPSRTAVLLLDSETGAVLWEYDHGGNATEGSAAVANGVAFVADGDGALHAIDLESGEEVWTIDYARQSEPIVADGVVYLGYYWLNELVAIDAETGDRLWTHETETIGFSQPIVGDGILYATVTDGVVALEGDG